MHVHDSYLVGYEMQFCLANSCADRLKVESSRGVSHDCFLKCLTTMSLLLRGVGVARIWALSG